MQIQLPNGCQQVRLELKRTNQKAETRYCSDITANQNADTCYCSDITANQKSNKRYYSDVAANQKAYIRPLQRCRSQSESIYIRPHAKPNQGVPGGTLRAKRLSAALARGATTWAYAYVAWVSVRVRVC